MHPQKKFSLIYVLQFSRLFPIAPEAIAVLCDTSYTFPVKICSPNSKNVNLLSFMYRFIMCSCSKNPWDLIGHMASCNVMYTWTFI